MFQRVKQAFNTPEGWAVAAGLLWALVAQLTTRIPVQFTLPGFGVVSAGMFIAFGLPLVLAKMGWTAPFQPVTTANLDKRELKSAMKSGGSVVPIIFMLACAALLTLGFVLVVHADTVDGRTSRWTLAEASAAAEASDSVEVRSILDLRNLAGGLELVGAGYQQDSTHVRKTAVELKAALSYGLTDLLSIPAGVIGSPRAKTLIEFVGLRVCLNPDNRTWQLGAGVDARHYDGAGFAWIAHRTSAAAVLVGAWAAAKRKDGSTAVFFKAAADWDVDNGIETGRLALAWQAFGGK